jgi:hypothetical protein
MPQKPTPPPKQKPQQPKPKSPTPPTQKIVTPKPQAPQYQEVIKSRMPKEDKQGK